MKVGFVGLGAMGRPMAANVLAGGHQLTVFDVVPAATRAFEDTEATVAESAREVAESCQVLITMLPRPSDVELLVLGPDGDGADGLAEAMSPGSTYVDMSTGDPQLAQRIAAVLGPLEIEALDCPVCRTQDHAVAGTLLVLAGGSDQAVRRIRPVLDCMASELRHLGGPGTGQAMKLVNNMLSLSVAEAVGEALAVGTRAGLDVEQIRQITGQTMAQTAQLDVGLWKKALTGDLAPGFALRLAEKDIGLATELAKRLGTAVPVTEQTLRRCAELRAAGFGDADFGVLATSQLAQPILPPVVADEPKSRDPGGYHERGIDLPGTENGNGNGNGHGRPNGDADGGPYGDPYGRSS